MPSNAGSHCICCVTDTPYGRAVLGLCLGSVSFRENMIASPAALREDKRDGVTGAFPEIEGIENETRGEECALPSSDEFASGVSPHVDSSSFADCATWGQAD